MAQTILPVTSWQNGQEKQATIFDLRIVNDNLSTAATFYYSLSSVEVSHMETVVTDSSVTPEVTTEVKVVDVPSQVLVEGNLGIDGADYQTWDADPSANAFAYNYAATKLNLTIVS
jgi:hypothetical protein